MSVRTRKLFLLAFLALIALNIIAFFHAYNFTHFSDGNKSRTDPKDFTFFGRLKTLAFGVDNPRPVNTHKPARPFETLLISHGNDTIECWRIPIEDSKGTVLIFHGYAGNKSQMIKESNAFNELGF